MPGTPSLVDRLVTRVRPTYLADGYHIWDHPLSMLRQFEVFFERLRRHGIPFDETDLELLSLTIAGHDALFAVKPHLFRLRSGEAAQFKEQVAADYVAANLQDFGASDRLIQEAVAAILATNPNFPVPPTVAAKLLVALDLYGLCLTYEKFHHNSLTLHQELRNLEGLDGLTEAQFLEGSIGYLAQFLCRMIAVTPEAYTKTGQSAFHTKAVENMLRWIRAWHVHGKVIAEIIPEGTTVIGRDARLITPGDTLIGFLPEETDRRRNLVAVKETAQGRDERPPFSMAIPYVHHKLSTPDGSCDRVYVPIGEHGAVTRSEYWRVLKPNGFLVIFDEETGRPVNEVATALATDYTTGGFEYCCADHIPYTHPTVEGATKQGWRREVTFIKPDLNVHY